MVVEGATDSKVFKVYVEHFLAPSLSEGQVVVLDNLGAHRPERIRELIGARGADLVFLPSYSPELNPIEEAFSKIKNILRKVGARTRESLVWRRYPGRSLRSRPGTRPDGSLIAATRSRFDTSECRCRRYSSSARRPRTKSSWRSVP